MIWETIIIESELLIERMGGDREVLHRRSML